MTTLGGFGSGSCGAGGSGTGGVATTGERSPVESSLGVVSNVLSSTASP